MFSVQGDDQDASETCTLGKKTTTGKKQTAPKKQTQALYTLLGTRTGGANAQPGRPCDVIDDQDSAVWCRM